MNKIAFLFLLYDKIQHQKLWEDFFSGDINNNKHTIYSHTKIVNDKTPDWIKKNKVRTIKTGWCSENLVKALCNMLKKALKDKTNTHFVFLSGTCIPLYDFNTTYKKVSRVKKTRLNFFKNLVFGDKETYSASQWIILNRKVAKDLIKLFDPKNKKSKKFLKTQRKRYKDHGVKIIVNKSYVYDDYKGEEYDWYGSCPDEVFPIEWFIKLYGKPSSQAFKKNIKFQETTWILWDPNFTHPYIINKTQLKEWRKEMCTSNSIFARKFTKGTAKLIGMKC